MENGNTFIGWGGQPKLSEVQPDGTLALEMLLGALSYRAFRFEWDGMPAALPRAVLEHDSDSTSATLYTSWNGATDITSYEVYAGPSRESMTYVTTVPYDGFETVIPLTGLPTDSCLFQTHPVHNETVTTLFSNVTVREDLTICQERGTVRYLPLVDH
jgi:hypothetical protein